MNKQEVGAGKVEKSSVENEVVSITTESLMGKRKLIVIRHDDKEYQLRITGNNKLILTK